MPNLSPFPQNIDPKQIAQLAASPAGKQLIALLQKSGGADLKKAMAGASSGDYDQAKNALSPLLNSPEVQALLKQLGG